MLQMHFDLLCFPPPPPPPPSPPPPSPLIVLPQQFQAKSRTLLMPTNNSNSKVSFLMSESPERKIKSTFKVCRQPVGLRRNMAEKGYIRRVECFFFVSFQIRILTTATTTKRDGCFVQKYSRVDCVIQTLLCGRISDELDDDDDDVVFGGKRFWRDSSKFFFQKKAFDLIHFCSGIYSRRSANSSSSTTFQSFKQNWKAASRFTGFIFVVCLFFATNFHFCFQDSRRVDGRGREQTRRVCALQTALQREQSTCVVDCKSVTLFWII